MSNKNAKKVLMQQCANAKSKTNDERANKAGERRRFPGGAGNRKVDGARKCVMKVR